ncbi:MAG TPA: DUF4349 domain-containing protein [Spirochaetota bacterium]|nr:DUF4349 domain-containing protein [Spirochaetota bacterium]
MKRSIAIIALCVFYAFPAPAANGAFTQEYFYGMFAAEREKAIARLRSFAAENNGYVKFYSNAKVVLRMPAERVQRIRDVILDTGYIGDERLQRTDVGESLLDLRTRLKTKESLLASLYKIFEDAQVQQTLEVEKELGKVVTEIENIKGRIAYLEDRVSLAEVTVSINTQPGAKKDAPGTRSRWDWVNSLGIEGLVSPGGWR